MHYSVLSIIRARIIQFADYTLLMTNGEGVK
jgi:hypothetical protein